MLLPLATTGAAVAVCAIAVVTLLLRRFDDAIAAVSEILPLAQDGAAVAIHKVAVVALFPLIEEAIPATGIQLRFSATEGRTAIPVENITVIALLLRGLGDAVAAERLVCDLFYVAERGAPISTPYVSVVTFLVTVEHAIAAMADR